MGRFLLAGLMAAAMALTGATSAKASNYYNDYCKPCYKKVVCYETVTCWETRTESYTKYVTKYDHCGRAYTCPVVCYRDVQVPYKKVVPVVKWVKCY
jgi:hypothetical protein